MSATPGRPIVCVSCPSSRITAGRSAAAHAGAHVPAGFHLLVPPSVLRLGPGSRQTRVPDEFLWRPSGFGVQQSQRFLSSSIFVHSGVRYESDNVASNEATGLGRS